MMTRVNTRRAFATIAVAGMLAATGGAANARTCDPGEDPGDDTAGTATAPQKDGAAKKTRPTAPATIPAEKGEKNEPVGDKTGKGTDPTQPNTEPGTVTGTATEAPAAGGKNVPDRKGETFTDKTGTESTYHLFTSAVKNQAPVGLVVYLDGDGQNGIKNPESPWALGGDKGVPAMAGARGYATLAPMAPGGATWWENGGPNATFVSELVEKTKAELGVQTVWLVGYSGGSQLITKFLLPSHGEVLAGGGGAVITGGGGASGGADKSTAPKDKTHILFKTGDQDTGTGSENYDALADSKKGAAEYKAAGFDVTEEHPAGLTHEGLGGEFGTILAGQLDKYPAAATGAPAAPGGTSSPGDATSSPTGPTTGDATVHDVAYAIMGSAENSTTDWKKQAGYIEYNVEKNAAENRGYTGGIVGFTSKTGDMLDMVKSYVKDKPDTPLAGFVPALEAANGTVSVAGLGAPFVDAWKTAADTDPGFLAAQTAKADALYWKPAVDQAAADELSPLGVVAYFDALVMHGEGTDPGSFSGIRAAAVAKAKTPKDGGDEKAYLSAFLDARAAAMSAEVAHKDTTRVDAQKALLAAGNLALTGTLEWSVYGQKFTTPGAGSGAAVDAAVTATPGPTGATPGAPGTAQAAPSSAPSSGGSDTNAADQKSLIDNVKSSLDALIAFISRNDDKPADTPSPTQSPTDIPTQAAPAAPSGDASARARGDAGETTPNVPGVTGSGTPGGSPSGESVAPEETR